MEVKMERDLFGSILFLPLQQKIGMDETLRFPWDQFLRSGHIDGSIQTAPKSSLLQSKKHELYLKPVPIWVLL